LPGAVALGLTAGASTLLNAFGASVAFQAIAGQAIAGALLSGVGQFAINTALSLGAAALANTLFRPKSKPSENQRDFRQALPPKTWSYGTVRLSGPCHFWGAKLPTTRDDRNQYKGVIIAAHEIEEYVTIYLNDQEVVLDEFGGVITAPYVINNFEMVRMNLHLGTADQAADPMLLSEWPEVYTANHRLRGIAHVVVAFEQPGGQSQFSQLYPNGEPTLSVLIKAKKVYDPRLDGSIPGGVGAHRYDDSDTWEWTENAALCALDYITQSHGYGISHEEMDLAIWMEIADVCDEPVTLAVGGTEARYRVATTISAIEPRKQALRRLLEAFAGELFKTREGLWGVRAGRWVEPGVTLAEDSHHFKTFNFEEPEALDRYNKLIIQCLSPLNKYVEVECDPWVDQASIDLIGEKSRTLDLTQVPSYTQARRLAKIRFYRDNPEFVASVQTNFYGLNCISQNIVNIDYPNLLVDGPFWLDESPRLAENFATAQLMLRKANPAAFDWTTAEEGTAPPIAPDLTEGGALLSSLGEYIEIGAGLEDDYLRFI
jgi:hypothetical protein